MRRKSFSGPLLAYSSSSHPHGGKQISSLAQQTIMHACSLGRASQGVGPPARSGRRPLFAHPATMIIVFAYLATMITSDMRLMSNRRLSEGAEGGHRLSEGIAPAPDDTGRPALRWGSGYAVPLAGLGL
jgi:hypothetical protein